MGSSKYMRVLWKNLPPEVLENVLACLPLHVLCRFRLVCKAWNHLISHPQFTFFRVCMPRTPSSILISPKLEINSTSMINWTVLDANENRSYPLSNSFLTTVDNTFWHPRWCKYTLAAEGGLIYIMYSKYASIPSPRKCVVCNLVDKSFHEIPELEICSSYTYTEKSVVISVESVKKDYQILTIVSPSYSSFILQGLQVFLFESVTSKWKKLKEDPVLDQYYVLSSVFKNHGVLYSLLVKVETSSNRLESLCPTLYLCEIATDVWKKVDVELPRLSCQQNKALLVVSLNRLFMVEYTGFGRRRMKQVVSLSISEIVLGTKAVVKLGHLRKFSKYPVHHDRFLGELVAAVGCGDSIVVSSAIGHNVRFDLVKKYWQKLPTWPTYSGPPNFRSGFGGICVGLVDY